LIFPTTLSSSRPVTPVAGSARPSPCMPRRATRRCCRRSW
jgi:hypothetical protein